MEIKLLFFGQVAEIVGKKELTLSDIDNTVAVKERLIELFPPLQSIKFAMAVNKQVIQSNTFISQNDTVALLPPFSGG